MHFVTLRTMRKYESFHYSEISCFISSVIRKKWWQIAKSLWNFVVFCCGFCDGIIVKRHGFLQETSLFESSKFKIELGAFPSFRWPVCRDITNLLILDRALWTFPRRKSQQWNSPSSGSRGCWGGHAPGPMKISHKKNGRQRRTHRFHVSRPPLTRPLDLLLSPDCVVTIAHINLLWTLCYKKDKGILGFMLQPYVLSTLDILEKGSCSSVWLDVTISSYSYYGSRWRTQVPATSSRMSYQQKDLIFISLGPIFIAQFCYFFHSVFTLSF